MFASFGSLPVTFCWLDAFTPLPASGNHCQSFDCCAPYFAIEKLESLPRLGPSFATQPMVGIVSIDCAPADLVAEIKSSLSLPGVELPSSRLSKYQSLPRLSAFSCQLYCDVAVPPLRFSGQLRSLSCAV